MSCAAGLGVAASRAVVGWRRLAVILSIVWAAAAAQPAGVASRLERAGQLEAAWREYRSAVERAPRDGAAFQGYARLSMQLGRADSLVALSRRLLVADTGNSLLALGLIEGLLGLKRRAEALAEARMAALRWPEQTFGLVEVLKQGREYATAAEVLKRLMAQTGFRADVALKLVELLELDQQYAAAARVFVEIANSDGHAAAGQLARLRLYGSRGAGRQVLPELAAIRDQVLRARAEAQVQLGAGNQVLAAQLMTRTHPAQELREFGRECERDGFVEAALAVYRSTGTGTDLARVLRRLGRNAEARQALGGDTTPAALLELGELWRAERDFAAAARAYRRLLAAQPRNEQALEGLAASELGLGRLDSAQLVLAKLATPTDRALLLGARIQFYRGELDSARERATELARTFPQSQLVNDGLELALLCHGGERAAALAAAMLDYETGADQAGLRRAGELSGGNDVVAEQASLLQAAILRRAGRPREALVVLDSSLARSEPGELRARTMLERALLFRDDLNDEERFRMALGELIAEFPASPYAPLARNLLAETAATSSGGVR